MSFFILFVGFAAAADAEWLSTSGEDPMTDKKWAGASAMFSPMGLPSVLFKCWEGGELQLGIVVGRYDDSASYAPILAAKFRVDKGEPVDILAQPQNLNGFLSLSATSADSFELVPLLKSILDSRQRVALAIGEGVFRSDVRGTSNAIGAMFKTCGLAGAEGVQDEPPKRADEADQDKKAAEAPVPDKAISPEPSKPTAAAAKLERDKCAVVLEAVKACEVLRDCSQGAVEKHFDSQRQSFDSMAGATVFTVANLNAQCREVCLQKSYKLGPARERLCGY